MQQPNSVKVSVIVPVFNAEKFLAQCLDSLVSQTLVELEVICVNDGSTDSSWGILKRYASAFENIRIINQSNQGQGAARNSGVAVARGQYIGFVDSDDYIAPEMYEKLYHYCTTENAEIVVCKSFMVDDKGLNIQPLRLWDTLPEGAYTQQDIVQCDFFNTGCSPVLWNKLFKGDIVRKYPSTNQRRGQDFIALIDYVSVASRLFMANDRLYYYRHHDHSVMAHPEDIMTLSVDLETEAIATEKILARYENNPVSHYYMDAIVKSWSQRMCRIDLNDNEKICLDSIFQLNFSYLIKYKWIYDELAILFIHKPVNSE